MRLDYNVLCIDDEIDSLFDYKAALKSVNDEAAITTNFIDISAKATAREIDETKLIERIKNQITGAFTENSFELILVDLHLGSIGGHEIIQHIRDTQTMYRPIIFYSGGQPKGQQAAIDQLHAALEQNGLVGKCIFLSSRDQLEDDLRKIGREMQTEEQKLTASRGMLMDRTSEVDALVINHLKNPKTWDQLSPEQADEFFKKTKERLKKKAKSSRQDFEFFTSLKDKGFAELKSCFLDSDQERNLRKMDSSVRNYILKALLCAQPAFKEHGITHHDYFNDRDGQKSISKLRNEYAHQTEVQLDAAHDAKQCKYIRTELKVHLKNVRAVTVSQ